MSQPTSRKEGSTTLATTNLTHWPPVSADTWTQSLSFPKSSYILRLISSCQTSSKYHSFQLRISHHPWLGQQSSWYAAGWCHFNRLLQNLIWLGATWTASKETCFIGTTGQPALVDRGLSDRPRSARSAGCHNFSGIWCSGFPLGNFLPDLSTWSAGVRIIRSWNVCWWLSTLPIRTQADASASQDDINYLQAWDWTKWRMAFDQSHKMWSTQNNQQEEHHHLPLYSSWHWTLPLTTLTISGSLSTPSSAGNPVSTVWVRKLTAQEVCSADKCKAVHEK